MQRKLYLPCGLALAAGLRARTNAAAPVKGVTGVVGLEVEAPAFLTGVRGIENVAVAIVVARPDEVRTKEAQEEEEHLKKRLFFAQFLTEESIRRRNPPS